MMARFAPILVSLILMIDLVSCSKLDSFSTLLPNDVNVAEFQDGELLAEEVITRIKLFVTHNILAQYLEVKSSFNFSFSIDSTFFRPMGIAARNVREKFSTFFKRQLHWPTFKTTCLPINTAISKLID